MDDREYVHDSCTQGLWKPNPKFTGNKYELFKYYKCKILIPLLGVKKYMKMKHCYVQRIPSGQLYISEQVNGKVCFTDAKENEHFKLI